MRYHRAAREHDNLHFSIALILSASARRWSNNPVNTWHAFSGKGLIRVDQRQKLLEPVDTLWDGQAEFRVARPRMAFASIVCCFTSRDRAECKARIPCCSMLLTGTNIMRSGRDAAVHSADAASAGSFFLRFFTKGLHCLGCDQFHLVSKTGQDPAQ